MSEITNSTYLDFMSWRYNDATTVPEAFGFSSGHTYALDADVRINLAFMIDRANDPSDLLALDWADRQQALASLEATGALWSTYGGSAAQYEAVRSGLSSLGIAVEGAASGYVSSAESRTLWVSLTPQQFYDLTGQRLQWVGGTADDPWAMYWTGNLNLPDAWSGLIRGLWVDWFTEPAADGASQPEASLAPGAQSPGNSSADAQSYYAWQVAELYNFPLKADSALATGIIGLVEPAIGAALPAHATYDFQTLLDDFRTSAGLAAGAPYYVVGNQIWDGASGRVGERDLDVGVVAAANGGSTIGFYAGPGLANQSNFTGYQSAVWDTANNPGVISSSWTDVMSPAPDSPFLAAYRELFVDAALRNLTMFNDASDGGSGAQIGNGLTNVWQNNLSPYAVVVGGTSLSTPGAAAQDLTLAPYLTAVDGGDLPILAMLVAGGMRTLPADANSLSTFIETVWNQHVLGGSNLNPGYTTNETGAGGVDITQSVPSYQQEFGLTPTSAGPGGGTGRGIPDVSANAGGNMYYFGPDGTEVGYGFFGTSAATPLWASLGVQLNAIFEDQGLPRLGYMTDLLYEAAVIAPGSFNDITIGNNISSFLYGGDIYSDNSTYITPTGYGYSAGPGYDLVTGLGTPNGMLLARAMTAIAHSQMWSDAPALAETSGGVLVSGVNQSLVAQAVLADGASISVHAGASGFTAVEGATEAQAWTRQFAQQAMQDDFDANLVVRFDGLSQVRPQEVGAVAGAALSVTVDGAAAATPQASLSNPYGFVDFVNSSADSAVELARPVAIAANAEGADDQVALVRLRQSAANESLVVTFYRVDTLDGAIDGVRPGAAGYADLVAERAYMLAGGGTSLSGPGFGQYAQGAILDVDQGDIIAMTLTDMQAGGAPHTYYAFASANERVDGSGVAHLWNYGLNTWGWEDLYGGGDLDYNDLVVQLDFTSASGSGVLI